MEWVEEVFLYAAFQLSYKVVKAAATQEDVSLSIELSELSVKAMASCC